MFNPDPSDKAKTPKLPKAVIMMIEKNNLVMAIKTLAAEENISMDEAKTRIDAYENALKVKQQQKLTAIANKQGIDNKAMRFDSSAEAEQDDALVKSHLKSNDKDQDFHQLKNGLDRQLNDMGYKKPLMPFWVRRLLIIAIVMIGVFWILWRIFS
ncbi:hypothetical protein [Psychrobacter aestuarii]|uniref:Putrescine-ornithine antiporter n=1 Tax=Psychrobacter aestuarii TaxID=556327 RepID=A0ABN0VXI4_9GAMM|nr:hypothetical protein [Psychrobacter aestuarii]